MSQKTPEFRKIRRVEIVSPQTDWPDRFEAEAARLRGVFGAQIIAMQHVGSTAIHGISAKPIIDFLIEVRDIVLIDAYNDAMAGLGYEAAGEFGIPGRRFFSRTQGDQRTHNVHIFQTGNPEIKRMLDFRDYLNAHPDRALAYSHLKQDLAVQFPEDISSYTEGKSAFVQETLVLAKAWREQMSVGTLPGGSES